jgi:inosose dehydratase
MNTPLSRRSFVKSAAALGLTALAAPATFAQAAPGRRLKVGHTGITWGYAPPRAEQAVKDVASLGYHCFESFGSVLEHWETRGGLGPVLEAAGLPLISAYCPTNLTDPARRKDEVAKMVRWGKLIAKCGGRIAVVGPDNVKRAEYDFAAARPNIIAALNEICTALADIGVTGALHPHSGSCVQTGEEVRAIYDAADTRYVKMAPDAGELLHGGSDPIPLMRDHLPVIVHAHLKDFIGGQYNDGFCPLGRGKLDVPACIAVLEQSPHDIRLMAELNPNRDPQLPKPALELARDSRNYLESLGYSFRTAAGA